MNLFGFALILATLALAAWAYQERQKEAEQRGFIVIGGLSLALIATILTIISAIISIGVNLFRFFEDDLWWWFH